MTVNLAIIIPIISITNIIGRQYLVPTGRDARYTSSVCAGAVVNVAVNLALIPSMGAMGAAIATVAAEIAVLAVQAMSVCRELPFMLYIRNSLPYIVFGALMFAVVRMVAGFLSSIWGLSVLGLAIEIAVGIMTFALFALSWCIVTRDRRFTKLIRKRFRNHEG